MDDEQDPRITRSREVVLDAATQLLAEAGYDGFTVDAVVARSGVAKTTIYRHWSSKVDLLAAAINRFQRDDVPIPNTGSLRDDLVALLGHLANELAEAGWSRSLPAIIERAEHDRALAERHASLVRSKSMALRIVLDRSLERGEISPDADLELAYAVLAGALFFRRLVLHERTDAAQVRSIVELVLDGLGVS